MSEKPELLYGADEIAQRVKQIGAEVGHTFSGREITVVGLMKSSLVFMADLIRQVPLEMTCHFLRSSSLRGDGGGSVRTDIVYSAEIPYEGRDILLLAAIVDTGITLNFLLDHIRERDPRSLKVAVLVDKPGERKVDFRPEWAAFTLHESQPDRFIVGYGLDMAENYRGLPYLGTIASAPGAGRSSGGPGGLQ